MTEIENFSQQLLQAINKVRAQPHSILQKIRDQMGQIDEDNVLTIGDRDPIQLEEGKSAHMEAIEFLKKMNKQTGLHALQWNNLLEGAAVDHQTDLTNTGSFSAVGSDGSNYKTRIEKYCRWGGSIFQASDFGERQDPIEVVISWLIDDGNPKRTARTNLLSVHQKHFAASFGSHPEAENCCVGVYAAQVVQLEVDEDDEPAAATDTARTRKLRKMDWKAFAQRIFELQNKIRKNPISFVPYLERSLSRFQGSIYTTEDGCAQISTEEGQVAFIEAIEFLRSQKSIPPLKWSKELEKAAKDHCEDLGSTGQMTSIGSDGSLPTDRMARYCIINETWAESSSFGSVTAEEVMEQMLVNDGQAHRGFRKNIFNRMLTIVGIAVGHHAQGGSIAQFEYAKGILKDGQTQQVNVTVTDQVPEKLIRKMKTMGIDTNRIKFNVESKKDSVASQPRQFQVESSTVQSATDQVRKTLNRTKTSLVSEPVKQKAALQRKPSLPLSTRNSMRKSTATASSSQLKQSAVLQKQAEEEQSAMFNQKPALARRSTFAPTLKSKRSTLTTSTQAAAATQNSTIQTRGRKPLIPKPTSAVQNPKIMHSFRTQATAPAGISVQTFEQAETVTTAPKQRRGRGDRSSSKNGMVRIPQKPSMIESAKTITVDLEEDVQEHEQANDPYFKSEFGTDCDMNGPFDPIGEANLQIPSASGQENDFFAQSDIVSSVGGTGSGRRMTRKERQQKRQGSIAQQNGGDENRLPDQIHGGETGGAAMTFAQQPKYDSSRRLKTMKTGIEEKKTASNMMPTGGPQFQRRGTLQVPQHDEATLRQFISPSARDLNFDVMDDPDYPPEAVNSNIIVEEIEMNGRIQKIYKKTYYMIDGKTINITRMEQA